MFLKLFCYLFCKKGNAKKLYKGSLESIKSLFGSFSTEKEHDFL